MTIHPEQSAAWAAFEREGCLSGTASDWRRAMSEHFELFRRAFFQKRPELSGFHFCEKCYRHHRVVPDWPLPASLSSSELIMAIDPGTDEDIYCPEIPLVRADIEVWALDWQKLARALANALNLGWQFSHLKLLNTYQVGSWSAEAVPVILTIQSEPAQFTAVVNELIARLKQKFILLAPTSTRIDWQSLERLNGAGAGFFALDSNVILGSTGILRSVRTPGELFARFTPQPKEDEQDVARRAFGLVQQLDSSGKPPTALTVFRLYCLENLSIPKIARQCRCSVGTIANRLTVIRRKTGMAPESLRRISAHFEALDDEFTDARAAAINIQCNHE